MYCKKKFHIALLNEQENKIVLIEYYFILQINVFEIWIAKTILDKAKN